MLQEPLHSVIIGNLLGDGCLSANGRHWRLRLDHSAKASEYIWWKYEMLKPIAAATPRLITVFDRRTQKVYEHLRFDTLSLPELDWYTHQFLDKGRRCVPSNIQHLLSELALAVWYMDDGHRRTDCNALRINTHAFTYEENQRLVDALSSRFGIQARLHHVVKAQWVLYIPSTEANRFCELIRRYVPPSMGYKLL
jgi:hypothetical protein